MTTQTTTPDSDDELTTFIIRHEGDADSQPGWPIDFSAFENENETDPK